METEEIKISFWKKLKISILKLEDYQMLASQKLGKTIMYLVKLMLIFAAIITMAITIKFGNSINQMKNQINQNIGTIEFKDNQLSITGKSGESELSFQDDAIIEGPVVINTNNLSEEEIKQYTEKLANNVSGVLILKDKVMVKLPIVSIPTTISFTEIANQYNINSLTKEDILQVISGNSLIGIYIGFYIIMAVYLFVIYFSTILLDVILYAILAHITGIISKLRLRFTASYNIAAHALTLPILLNLIYMIVNTFTGFTIRYFNIMYTAIVCIYIVASILLMKSEVIKKQIELSKIIEEQEKVRQEMERKEQEEKEQAERERLKKEEEKKKKQKEKEEGQAKEKEENLGEQPQPEGNN